MAIDLHGEVTEKDARSFAGACIHFILETDMLGEFSLWLADPGEPGVSSEKVKAALVAAHDKLTPKCPDLRP